MAVYTPTSHTGVGWRNCSCSTLIQLLANVSGRTIKNSPQTWVQHPHRQPYCLPLHQRKCVINHPRIHPILEHHKETIYPSKHQQILAYTHRWERKNRWHALCLPFHLHWNIALESQQVLSAMSTHNPRQPSVQAEWKLKLWYVLETEFQRTTRTGARFFHTDRVDLASMK